MRDAEVPSLVEVAGATMLVTGTRHFGRCGGGNPDRPRGVGAT